MNTKIEELKSFARTNKLEYGDVENFSTKDEFDTLSDEHINGRYLYIRIGDEDTETPSIPYRSDLTVCTNLDTYFLYTL